MREHYFPGSAPSHVCPVPSNLRRSYSHTITSVGLLPREYTLASTFLHPFAPPALPGFDATMGALTPPRRDLRILMRDNERPSVSAEVSLLRVFDLPTIPSSTTILPFPHRGFSTLPQPDEPSRLSPGQTVFQSKGFRRRALGGSPLASRLPDRLGRIRFVILRTGCSPPVASHPSSRRRGYGKLQVCNVNLMGTCTPSIKHFQRRTHPGAKAPRTNARTESTKPRRGDIFLEQVTPSTHTNLLYHLVFRD